MNGGLEPARGSPGRVAARLAAAGMALAGAAAGQPVREAVTVREVAVLVVPPAEQASWRAARRPGGIEVFEDGVPRPVTRVEELAEAGEDGAANWQVALYWDAELAGPNLGRAAARLLADQAARITRLGEATLIVAGEAPRIVVASTRDPPRLATALDDLAAATPSAAGPSAAPPISGAALAHRCDVLLEQLGRLPAATPRLLLLPLRRFVLGPAAMNALAGAPPAADLEADERQRVAAIERLGRELAGAGWVLLPIALTSEGEAFRGAHADAHDRWRDSLPVEPPETGGIVLFRFPRRRPGRGPEALDIDAALDLSLAPLRHLASATTGRTITRESQLAGVLAELASRWLVWYQAPPPAAGAPARRLVVRLASDRRPLAAPRWRR